MFLKKDVVIEGIGWLIELANQRWGAGTRKIVERERERERSTRSRDETRRERGKCE